MTDPLRDMTDTTPTPPTVIWVHGDMLSPQNPAFARYPDAPAIYVWDDALLADYHLSLKRVTFIYECLLELPVTIRRGDVAAEVARFAAAHDASTIATVETPAPRFAAIRDAIEAHPRVRVEVLPGVPFVSYRGVFDLKRFSRYWRVAEPYARGQ